MERSRGPDWEAILKILFDTFFCFLIFYLFLGFFEILLFFDTLYTTFFVFYMCFVIYVFLYSATGWPGPYK